jgi:membrane-associated phospholipid phosphatase
MSGFWDRWQAGIVTRRIWRRFHRFWKWTPEPARHAWLLSLTWGWAATAGVMVLLSLVGQRLDLAGRLVWETPLLEWIDAELPLSFGMAVLLDGFGNPIPLVAIVTFIAVFAVWERRPLHALTFLAAFFCMAVVVLFGWAIWDRPRPTVIMEGVGAPGDGFHSFPSGHMAQSTAVYGMVAALWVRHSRSWLERLIVVAAVTVLLVLIGVGRLRIGAHWPSDIVAGAMLGLFWLSALVFALRRAARVAAGVAGSATPVPEAVQAAPSPTARRLELSPRSVDRIRPSRVPAKRRIPR